MATDDRDTDDETDERTGTDAGRSSETPGTYANAGREGEARTRQQAWDAQGDVPQQSDALRARSDRPVPDRGRPERRYGTGKHGTGQPSRQSRRYGSENSKSSQETASYGQKKQKEGQDEVRGGRDEPGPRDRTEGQSRAEATPPKRTQPLREPMEPSERVPGRETESERPPERRAESEREDDSESEATEQSGVPKYGGPRDRGQPSRHPDESVERQRTRREYERRFDKRQARQRDFQRDKSGGKYRRK